MPAALATKVAFTIIVSSSAAFGQAAAGSPAPTDATNQAGLQLQEALPELLAKAEIPGASAAWVQNHRLAWSGNFGVRNADSGAPVVPETVFEAASLSKPVVAYVAMRLVARGELDLDAPLWDAEGYERLAHDDRARRITARMVLSHTSGLPNWGGTPLELNADPGTTWNYSGEGFVFLATMLERRTGLALDDLAQREAFGPLGMSSSSFVWRNEYDRTSAAPHDLIGRASQKNQPETANAAASLHTTATDYARFVIAVMKGEGLSQTAAKEMLTAQAGIGGWGDRTTWEHLSWSLGWGIQHQDDKEGSKQSDAHTIWHWGDNGNFRCFVMADSQRGDAFVLFTNSYNGLSIVAPLLDLTFEKPHWAVRYLDYPPWDKPRQVARRAVHKAFLVDGPEAGWPVLRRLASEFPSNVAENETRRVANALASEGDAASSLAVMEWSADRFPSASSQRGLAEAYTNLGRYQKALKSYEKALALDEDLREQLTPRIEWLRQGLAAEVTAYKVTSVDLDAFVGSYGPREIEKSGDRLMYSRQGASSETPLIPLAPDLFALETVNTFRIRFERDADGRVIRIVGLYSDGRVDQSERSD